jgi:hypothetical protein
MAGALSAFAEPAVRTAEYKFGAMNMYGLDVRVWGVRLHQERINVTRTNLQAQALMREHQWRLGLAATTAWISGGAAAAIAAALFARPRNWRT